MTPYRLRRTTQLLVITFIAAGLLGCAASAGPEMATAGDVVDGGGAAEVAEPALALVVADEHGGLTLIDLDTGERAEIAEPGADRIAGVDGSGRFIFVVREKAGDSVVSIVDSGRWTVPHGDHSHYFRGEPRALGIVDGAGQARLGIEADATVIRFDGEAAVLDHETLGEGAVDPQRSPLPGDGPAVIVAGQLVEASDAGIETRGATAAPCREASDVDLTRVGAVFACADGAVLASRDIGGAVSLEALPYPAGVDTPALALAGRSDRPDLAGVAGDRGIWLLDVRERAWTFLTTDAPVIAAAAIGDDGARTAVLAADGTVRVLAPDAAVLARTEPILADALADPMLREGVRMLVDGDHAWVSDPAGGSVIEIDLDDGRVTRRFDGLQPWSVELVG